MIFEVLGTPTEEDCAFVTDEKATKYLASFKKGQRENLHERYKGASPEALDLLDKMLQFNPFFRISVDDALDHPCFSKIRKVEEEKNAESPVSIDFENEALSTGKLRELFMKAIEIVKNKQICGMVIC